MKRLRQTAYHEASHAVIGRVLTLYCDGATIKPNYKTRTLGHTICHDQWACFHQWEIRSKVRDNNDAVWHARMIAFMAGAEGEVELLGSTYEGDGDDRYQIYLMASELVNCSDWPELERRLGAMTRMQICKEIPAILR